MKIKLLLMIFIAIFILILGACGNENEMIEEEETEEVERLEPEELAAVFLEGDYERVYGHMSDAFQKEVSLQQLQALGEDFNEGVSSYHLQSEVPYGQEAVQYVWTDDTEEKGMIAVFDEEGIIQGLQIMPLEKYLETDEIFTKTSFDMPFADTWFVFWGGVNNLVNYHYAYENQRYAYDFVIHDDNGNTYDGDPTLNENYYAFGKEYLAPADGTVVKVENDVEDNEPVGKMNEKEPLGNYVIIDHGNDEYGYLAHFKYGSIEVNEGDKVQQGDLLGLVGNSGNSSEPHIHFHVADTSDPTTSKSIRISFERDEEMVQGDYVE